MDISEGEPQTSKGAGWGEVKQKELTPEEQLELKRKRFL
jgi:hypothetical protein